MQAKENVGRIARTFVEIVHAQVGKAWQRVEVVRREGITGQIGEALVRRSFDVHLTQS